MSAVDLAGHGTVDVRVRPQRSSWLLRLAGATVTPLVREAWVTIGETIYHPESVAEPLTHRQVLAHEWVHVLQWQALGWRFAMKYATAKGRWEIEREAFLHEVRYYGRSIESVVDALSSDLYRLGMSRNAIRSWFAEQVDQRRRV
jgi:hypothetical protein